MRTIVNTSKNVLNSSIILLTILLLIITLLYYWETANNKNLSIYSEPTTGFLRSDSLLVNTSIEKTYGVEQFALHYLKRKDNEQLFNSITLIGEPINWQNENPLDLDYLTNEHSITLDKPDEINIGDNYIYNNRYAEGAMGNYWLVENYFIKYNNDYLFLELLTRYRSDDSNKNRIIRSQLELIDKLKKINLKNINPN